MKSNFSKIDENIADAPYRVNRKALGPGGSGQPAAPRQAPRDKLGTGGTGRQKVSCKMVLTLAVGCGTLLGVFAELPNCGYL
jgi:hypothetical protein